MKEAIDPASKGIGTGVSPVGNLRGTQGELRAGHVQGDGSLYSWLGEGPGDMLPGKLLLARGLDKPHASGEYHWCSGKAGPGPVCQALS